MTTTYDNLQVDIGNAPDDDQGDPLRTAFDKINQRFAEMRVFLNNRGDWAPNTVYTANPNRDWVIVDGVGYLATSNHTSGATFAADLAAGKWVEADALLAIAEVDTLRDDLASTAAGKGAELVGFKQAGADAVDRTALEKMREVVSADDFSDNIQAALDAHSSVRLTPGKTYNISAPISLPNGCNLYMDGAIIVSTSAAIFRFPSGGVAAVHAARAVIQTNTSTPGKCIAISDGATAVTEAYIYGYPLIIAANTIINDGFRGIDISGFYRSHLEVKVYGFYHGIYGDGNNGATLATYYNVLMKPDIRCSAQGHAIFLTNLVNATTIISPFINGGGVGRYGIWFDNNSAANNVFGGYIEGFEANASTGGLLFSNSTGNTVMGVTLDQDSSDASGSYAIKMLGSSSGNSIINTQFAGAWNDTSRMLFNNATGRNTFLGNGYSNAFVLGLSAVGLDYDGLQVSKVKSINGVDFSDNAHAPGMTSEVLGDYEEGTWSPNQGAGLTVVGAFSSTGRYTKIGRQVTVTGQLIGATSVACISGGVMCSNLPFSATTDSAGVRHDLNLSVGGSVYVSGASVYAVGSIAATGRVYFTATYFV